MPRSIEETLRLLDAWYNEPSTGDDRPKLISKLALLELCGWIEGAFDEMIRNIGQQTISDDKWVNEKLIDKTYGFKYDNHLRAMIVELVGEVFARRIEEQMENANSGDLDRMRSTLGELWKKRCSFAHADVSANVASQAKFDAPSWSINQHRILKKLFVSFESAINQALDTNIRLSE
jgi:hypothetical protein